MDDGLLDVVINRLEGADHRPTEEVATLVLSALQGDEELSAAMGPSGAASRPARPARGEGQGTTPRVFLERLTVAGSAVLVLPPS